MTRCRQLGVGRQDFAANAFGEMRPQPMGYSWE